MKLLLLDLGAGPLPAATPVSPVTGSWMPAVYTPPPPPAPGGFMASPVADAVLLTWTASAAYSPLYIVERAPDVAGVPGRWAEVTRTPDLRYTVAEPLGLGAWYRVRALSLNRLSSWTAAVVAAPIASNPPRIELAIVGGVVVVNCLYDQFYLRLTANAAVQFVNMPTTKTMLMEVEQAAPGGHALTWPASVVPVSGVPYVPSATPGAVDLVGLTTNNAGATVRLTAQKPVDAGTGSFAVSASPNPASASAQTDGATAAAPSVQLTASVAGGTAPFVHAWSRADSAGGADFLIDNAASAAPTLSIAAGTTYYPATTQHWRDAVTDAAGLQAQVVVPVTLERLAPALLATFNGASAWAAGAGTTGPSGGTAWVTFKRNGTWECWGATTSDGITAAATLLASGNWHGAPTSTIGDGYEVRFTQTASSGGGTVSNGAPDYVALTGAATVQLDLLRSTIGAATATRTFAVSLRQITNTANAVNGSVHLEASGENS